MDVTGLPHSPGVYLMRDQTGKILYIGKARDLRKRVASYFLERSAYSIKINVLVSAVHHIDYLPTASEREAFLVEQRLIRRLQPTFNTAWRDDKSYPYIKLTLQEDFPRLFLTRKRLRDGAKYFGPYPNTTAIRHLLRSLWRTQLLPLRPCHYEFSESQPLPLAKAKQCLYYHTQECPAPCVGRISKEGYRQIARDAELFFRGRTKALVEEWQNEMKMASQKMDYERAAQLRDHLATLQHMEERVTLRRISLPEVETRVDLSRALSDLQKDLGMKTTPLRIECFDISHFQGAETVASLVVFERGVPKKEDYRKYKIRSVAGIDDFASIQEVVGRRYHRLLNEGKALPDLILIDGGKGQLSAAVLALKQIQKNFPPPVRQRLSGGRGKEQEIPIAALAKREEELFIPNSEEPIRLPKDSPALHLVQRVRDEAHRFAIAFHRQRRSKGFLQH